MPTGRLAFTNIAIVITKSAMSSPLCAAQFRGRAPAFRRECVVEILNARKPRPRRNISHRQRGRRQQVAGLVNARTHDLLLHGRAQDAAENGFHDRMRTTEVGKDVGGGRSPDYVAPDEDECV